MRLLLRRVRQLHRLAVFEAIGRLGTFTAAAHELGTSQPAVSRQMACLERSLGTALFERHTNRRTLTPRGRVLYEALSESFDVLESALTRVHADSDHLRVAIQPSVAQSWFAPRLRELRAQMAPAQVSLTMFDHDRDLVDLEHDVSIRFGEGQGSRLRSERLVAETVMPVAAPELARELGLSSDSVALDLVDAPLLQVDQTDRVWQHWASWFDAHCVTYQAPPDALSYPTYGSALPSAIAGNGVILSWHTLSGDLLDRGLLCQVGPAVTSAKAGYYLYWPAALASDDTFLRFRAWLHTTISSLS